MAVTLKAPSDVLLDLRDRFKRRRLGMNLTQAGLAKRSGVSLGTLKRFESAGLIALDSLLKLALVLDCLSDFEKVAADDERIFSSQSLDQILAGGRSRKKGRLK